MLLDLCPELLFKIVNCLGEESRFVLRITCKSLYTSIPNNVEGRNLISLCAKYGNLYPFIEVIERKNSKDASGMLYCLVLDLFYYKKYKLLRGIIYLDLPERLEWIKEHILNRSLETCPLEVVLFINNSKIPKLEVYQIENILKNNDDLNVCLLAYESRNIITSDIDSYCFLFGTLEEFIRERNYTGLRNIDKVISHKNINKCYKHISLIYSTVITHKNVGMLWWLHDRGYYYPKDDSPSCIAYTVSKIIKKSKYKNVRKEVEFFYESNYPEAYTLIKEKLKEN